MAEKRKMGFDLGLNDANTCFKRRFRWMFKVDALEDGSLVSGDNESQGQIDCLPPLRSSRPNISFKEMEAQHLNETIFYPSKPEWKPIPLSLYDIKKNNPVTKWLSYVYDAKNDAGWFPSKGFKRDCSLEMYDGCGAIIEKWKFENAWPQNIEFGELDMSSSEVMTIDLTLRYDRAYIEEEI